MTPMDVVRGFYRYIYDRVARVSPLPASTASCAQACVYWSARLEATATVKLGEQLRVLELLRHPALSPAAFQFFLDMHSDRCPLDKWCAFCDEGRPDVVVYLEWAEGSEIQALYKALLGWTEDKASGGFHQLKQAVQDAELALCASERDRTQRVSPIKISLCFDELDWREAREHCRRLEQALLRKRSPVCFRILCGPHDDIDADALVLPSRQFPPTHGDYDWSSVLSPVVPLADDVSTAVWSPSTSALVTENVVSLDAYVTSLQDAQRLHEILRSQSTALRALEVGYVWHCHGMHHGDSQRLYAEQVDALFSHRRQSALRKFTLSGPVDDSDLAAMIARLASSAAAPLPTRGNRLEQFTCRCWYWTKIRGATLAELVQAIGGVDSLHLRDKDFVSSFQAIPIVELPDLVQRCKSLWALEADVACAKPAMGTLCSIPEYTADDNQRDESLPRQRSSLERLCLRPIDRDAIVAPQTIDRLLLCVGHSLRSLSLVPHQVDFQLEGEMAKVIVQRCPTLQELKVARVHAKFIDELVSELEEAVGDGGCQLQRLEFHHLNTDAELFAPLFAALSNPTHPLTRSLRWLQFTFDNWADNESIQRVIVGACDLLMTNRHLTGISIYALGSSIAKIPGSRLVAEPTVPLLPPMRHRLALWSVFRPRDIPRDIVRNVLTMLSRHVPRLRFLKHNDDEDEWS
ncbi:hypothetical protein PINS_up006650 [Pythium insidiosum]|nr:hypothetical protein PINS_up006650 [Pythium insidiosum]